MASSNLTIWPAFLQGAQKVSSDLLNGGHTTEEKNDQGEKHLNRTTGDTHTTLTGEALERSWPTRDDAMPIDAQRHMAAFLSSISSPIVPAHSIAVVLKNSTYVNQKRKILGRTLLPKHTTRNITRTQPPTPRPQSFQDLPAELLAIIKDMLPPADVIALSFTSRSYYNTLDFQLVDLRTLVLASDLYAAFPYHKFSHAINRERYDVCRRLRRDKMAHLLTLEDHPQDSLLCSACTTLHPARYFSPPQLATPPLHRTCLATTATLRVCAHWSETIQTLRHRNEDARCRPSALPTAHAETCPDPAHYTAQGAVYDPPPSLRQLGGIQYLSKTIRIGHTDDYALITPDVIKHTLEKDPIAQVPVCRHVNVGDEKVIGKFRSRERSMGGGAMGVKVPEFEAGGCEVCGVMWQFRLKDMLGRCVARYEVQLSVDWEVKAAREPWTGEWLRLVEGGEGLMKLL